MRTDQPAVLVDVDGTLVDTNYLHAVAWWRAFKDIGEDVPMYKIHPLIGMGSDQLVHRLIGRESEDASEAHSRHYEPFKKELRVLPGAADLLRELARRDARVILATSWDEEDLARLREVIDADDAIEDAVSKGDVDHSKPSPDIFEAALKKFDLDPERTLVVGDTTWDVEAAAKVDLKVICVLTGGTPREQLETAGAIGVYEDAAELVAQLDDSPLGTLVD